MRNVVVHFMVALVLGDGAFVLVTTAPSWRSCDSRHPLSPPAALPAALWDAGLFDSVVRIRIRRGFTRLVFSL